MKPFAFYIGLATMVIATISNNIPCAIFGSVIFLSAFLAAIEDAILSLRGKN